MRLVNILMEYPDSTMHQVSVYSIQRTADGTLIMSYYDHGVDGNLLVDESISYLCCAK